MKKRLNTFGTQLVDLFRSKNSAVALSLSGGAVHGAAHIGVLQVLEEAGLRPAIITGTSAGALVGGAYAAGVTPAELEHIFMNISWRELLRPAWRESLGLFNTAPMEAYIGKIVGNRQIEDLPVKFAAVACDILTGQPVILNNGSLASAMRASAAVPGVFTPVQSNGHLLVDGGLVDNLPSELAREMGGKYVIGVDVSNHDVRNFRPTNTIDILLATMVVMQHRSAFPEPEDLDCYIRPEIDQYSSWKMENIRELIDAGKEAAHMALSQLKVDLKLAA